MLNKMDKCPLLLKFALEVGGILTVNKINKQVIVGRSIVLKNENQHSNGKIAMLDLGANGSVWGISGRYLRQIDPIILSSGCVTWVEP